ncbi:3001_t:CDS:2 [Ambispora leptoticha]|uniref:3001_t:CDS:1 n=1 Tax=Ambispora leptoticha TaxID=144679 RepID=A0A9N9FIN9_9GLOM|nr:3001_t:CDS:2 [Ambispora leptoticha]
MNICDLLNHDEREEQQQQQHWNIQSQQEQMPMIHHRNLPNPNQAGGYHHLHYNFTNNHAEIQHQHMDFSLPSYNQQNPRYRQQSQNSLSSTEERKLHQETAERILRLFVCPACNRLFTDPVTLSCGNTFCRNCFKYQCPDIHCGRRHSLLETRTDVTVSKLTELCVSQLSQFIPTAQHRRYLRHLLQQQQFQRNFANDDDDRAFIYLQRHFENEESDDENDRLMHNNGINGPFANSGNNSNDNNFIHTRSNSAFDTEALLSLNLAKLKQSILSELDCQVCYSLLIDPITTPCGHSFCKPCLTRSFDHNKTCPMCRHQLHISYTFLTNHPANKTITLVLESLYPNQYEERRLAVEHELYDTMEDTPIFVCSLIFPKMPCFLHVYEPKYRLMLRRCLESNQRHFGMVLPERNGQGYNEYGTILEIRSAEFLTDGRAQVETVGLYRFRVLERNQKDGYNVGRIERIDDIDPEEEDELERRDLEAAAINNSNPANPPMNEQPTARLISLAREFIDSLRNGGAPWLLQRLNSTYGEMPDDPSDFSFWVASVIPIDEYEKSRLLELRSVRERLKIINLWITQLREQWWFARGCCVS